MSDHRDNIHTQAGYRADSLRAALRHDEDDCEACDEGSCEVGGHWSDEFLEIEVFRSTNDPERTIVCLLLGCGGPTTRVTVDQWDTVTFFHSWGKANNDADAPDQTEMEVWGGDDADTWRQVAEMVSEVYA
jgi:hypothetical protein